MRYRIEQKGKPYRYVDSIDAALYEMVKQYPPTIGFSLKYRKALDAGRSPIVQSEGAEVMKIIPCKDLAPCPKCGQPMTGLGDECLDCEANYN